jgi:hypothetical protein
MEENFMASKRDFSTASKGLLGLNDSKENQDTAILSVNESKADEQSNERQPEDSFIEKVIQKEPDGDSKEPVAKIHTEKTIQKRPRKKGITEDSTRTTIYLSEKNLQFIEDIKTLEGGSLRTVLNDLLDDIRISKRDALEKALEIHKQGRKAWKNTK